LESGSYSIEEPGESLNGRRGGFMCINANDDANDDAKYDEREELWDE